MKEQRQLSESIEVDPRLTKYAEMYERWSAVSKSRLDWKRVQAAMLANDGALLKQTEAIPNGPIMFGADKAGNILFANGGVEPILTRKTYSVARKVAKAIGLDFFPYVAPYEKSEEILAFEAFTGKPIVMSGDKQTHSSIWLESGEDKGDDGDVHVAGFEPFRQHATVAYGYTGLESDARGVRGLLRVKA